MGRKRIHIDKNERYGHLTTTGNNIKRGSHILWECVCDCGNVSYVSSSDLKRGHSKSCGKCNDKAYNTGLNYLYGNYKRGAINRNLSFNISKDEFNTIINQNCFYCNSKPNQILYKDGMQTPFIYNGIDRVNNNIGYELDNIVSCCGFCNMAKGSHTINEFEAWISRLIEYRNSINLCEV